MARTKRTKRTKPNSKGPNPRKFFYNVDDDGSETRRRLALSPEERRADVAAFNADWDARSERMWEANRILARPGPPPTPKQLGYLRHLGYKGGEPGTKRVASELIDQLLKGKP